MNAASRHTSRTQTATRLSPPEALILIACVLALAFAYFSMFGESAPSDLETRTVHVAQSQTLWDLAVEYPISGCSTAQTVEHIKNLNGMQTSALQAGQSLLVPAQDSGTAVLAAR